MTELEQMHELFSRWRRLGFDMQHLSSLVQNDAQLQESKFTQWLEDANKARKDLNTLIHDTGMFVANYSKFKLDE